MPIVDLEVTTALLNLMTTEGRASKVRPDGEGWVSTTDLAAIITLIAGREVSPSLVRECVRGVPALETHQNKVRIRRRSRSRRHMIPDILFHATTADGVKQALRTGRLSGGRDRQIFLSHEEDHAWRAAHRLRGSPRVLAVDTLRARRGGFRFRRNRQNGLYVSYDIPNKYILHLRDGFDVQLSAGGIPIRKDPDGKIRMALIQVTRRSGITWEVAKGKLEPGETPEATAVREVAEEMGVTPDFRVLREIGLVRYGFLAPGGLPRLKSIFLYLMTPTTPLGTFVPATAEGIGDVSWFTPERACQIVTHTSLQPLMHRARDLVGRYGLTPSPNFTN